MFMAFLSGMFYSTTLYSAINCGERKAKTDKYAKHMYLGIICVFTKSCPQKIGFKVQRYVEMTAAEV